MKSPRALAETRPHSQLLLFSARQGDLQDRRILLDRVLEDQALRTSHSKPTFISQAAVPRQSCSCVGDLLAAFGASEISAIANEGDASVFDLFVRSE